MGKNKQTLSGAEEPEDNDVTSITNCCSSHPPKQHSCCHCHCHCNCWHPHYPQYYWNQPYWIAGTSATTLGTTTTNTGITYM